MLHTIDFTQLAMAVKYIRTWLAISLLAAAISVVHIFCSVLISVKLYLHM